MDALVAAIGLFNEVMAHYPLAVIAVSGGMCLPLLVQRKPSLELAARILLWTGAFNIFVTVLQDLLLGYPRDDTAALDRRTHISCGAATQSSLSSPWQLGERCSRHKAYSPAKSPFALLFAAVVVCAMTAKSLLQYVLACRRFTYTQRELGAPALRWNCKGALPVREELLRTWVSTECWLIWCRKDNRKESGSFSAL